jgi:hypothetical protein
MAPNYHQLLLDEVADRWAAETTDEVTSIWFEIESSTIDRSCQPSVQ